MNMDKLKPLADWVLVRKCEVGEARVGPNGRMERQQGGIVLPEWVAENTEWVEVIRTGPKCREFTAGEHGATTLCPDQVSNDIQHVKAAYWMVRERALRKFVVQE
jgi:hypothetical protein